MTKRLLLSAAFAFTIGQGAMVQGALAQTAAKPDLVGTFNAWSTWSYSGSYNGGTSGKVCYIYAEPTEMQPKSVDHGRVSFSITMSPTQGVQNEANFVAGYALKEQSPVTVDIDGKKFTMFTQGDSAWLLNKAEEPQLLSAMRSGKKMTVTAVSRRGTNTIYNYSLSGVTAASQKMQSECK
jgi:invasion protein IalB